ncbi:MAG: prolyl oligopeptidase family serine peptidase [Acidimicrobiales bacterium]
MTDRPYPKARRSDQADDYHGELVPDPYRWLEQTDDPETLAWTRAENELTEAFLATVATRESIRARLTALSDHRKFGVPFERGGLWFQARNTGLQDQPVLWVMDGPADEGRVLLDPNSLSGDGTVALTGLEVTDDGSKLAYATSSAGSDWRTWRVREVATGTDLDDVVEWSKFGPLAWRKDGSGFYYVAMQRPRPGSEYLQESRLARILFHRLRTSQDEDELVFEALDEPEWLPRAKVSDDGRFVIVSITRGTFPETQVRVLDLERPEGGYLQLISDFAQKACVLANVGRTFYVLTDWDAPLQRIVAVDLDHPAREMWREVVGETGDCLCDAYFCGGRLVCHYLHHASSQLRVHDLDGSHVHDVPLPAMSAVTGSPRDHEGIEGRGDANLVHFALESFTEPASVWQHDLSTGETRVLRPAGAPIEPGLLITEQVFATSNDGTKIPLFLSRRRDVSPSGDVPVLLYGYGGFDIPVRPDFQEMFAAFMERGGLFAAANLRGGGEYGTAWHDAGRLANKQNVFDDFCACARWLAGSGWSRPERIAIIGASNGGLLVGACLTEHPELFGAAVAMVGVLDMLRFNKFTIGWAWTSDFGDPDDPEQYRWLRAYSPLHNLRQGGRYPATLVLTGDHDDRVVPGHSFKFAAALQEAQGGDRPVLIRVETSAGHGAGKPTAKLIAEGTDVLAFLEAVL